MKKSLTEFIEGLLGAGTLSVEGSCGKTPAEPLKLKLILKLFRPWKPFGFQGPRSSSWLS